MTMRLSSGSRVVRRAPRSVIVVLGGDGQVWTSADSWRAHRVGAACGVPEDVVDAQLHLAMGIASAAWASGSIPAGRWWS